MLDRNTDFTRIVSEPYSKAWQDDKLCSDFIQSMEKLEKTTVHLKNVKIYI